jgi:KaiC/GvpD/RAD55 family RecA-like ATPase
MRLLESLVFAPTQSCCNSGFPGAEHVLAGGVPKGLFYLLEDEPGTGRTTLAPQIHAEGR